MPTIRRIKQLKREIIGKHAHSSDLRGGFQTLTVLAALLVLWTTALYANRLSHWSLLVSVPLISLFLVRVFALMHECGHASLFRSRWLNRAVGFLFGVISGMPQYVWSRHHNHHHATNGNWEKYRGAVSTLSVREFGALSRTQQDRYQKTRNMAMAPAAGFIYLVFNPRFTWLKGTMQLWLHVMRSKRARPTQPLSEHTRSFNTRFWTSRREYWHMAGNNLVLLSSAAAIGSAVGFAPFLTLYLLSTSFAGAVGLVLFTVQHNFEHAHATNTARWDHDVGAIRGTSFLVLPYWLNWFTANIGYHHVHHLSANIPNYCLVGCHNEYAALFVEVPRISLGGIRGALECILWDEHAERIISIAEYRQQIGQA